ncbi:hypothetical protein K435DRAFT_837080 [Dendrothele bispora CBS 962.96]|uniref:N-terminal Ras-GEF domain-containing protein n=1 Tax=Dendrothele bispora (strain CBS 962.96) TaxID=1314807 RepID=A0A4S8ME55_DENBC|nr:hypothetical protein K435DRAFT_837080 [Dendrothele bispora CBS 962.96]
MSLPISRPTSTDTAVSLLSSATSCNTQSDTPRHTSLIDNYPSIALPLRRLKQLEGSDDVPTLLTYSEKFTNSLFTFVSSMPDRLPREKSTDSEYALAHAAVLFVMKQFSASVTRIHPIPKQLHSEGLAAALEMLDMVISSLVALLDNAYLGKMLPPPPSQDLHRALAVKVRSSTAPQPPSSRSSTLQVCSSPATQKPTIGDRKSLIEMVDEARLVECQSVETISQARETSSLQSKTDSVVARISHATLEVPSISPPGSKERVELPSGPPATLAGESTTTLTTSTISSTVQSRSKNSRIIQRFLRLSFNFPFARSKEKLVPGFLPSEISGIVSGTELSPPVGSGLADGKFDDAKLEVRSVSELMDLVTSKAIVSQPELKELFFTTFRWYLPAKVFISELADRFRASSGLEPAQAKIWLEWQQKHDNNQLRIMNLILIWLKQYWIPDLDNQEALPLLQEFALSHLVNYPDETLVFRIIHALNDVEKRTISRQKALRNHWNMLNSGTLVTPPDPSGFNLVISSRRSQLCKLLQFDSPEGRVEFARQLTIYFSELHGRLDADSFVWGHYHDLENDAVKMANMISGQEEGLREWVVASIQSIPDLEQREVIVHFWFGIAQWFNDSRYANINELLNWGRSGYMKQSRMRRAQNLPCIQTLFSVKEGIDRLKDTIDLMPERPNYDRYSLLAKCIADLDHAKLSYKFTKCDAIQKWIETQLIADLPDPKP